MKRYALPLLSLALLAACNQTPPAEQTPATPGATPAATATDTVTVATEPASSAAPQLETAPGPETVVLTLRFKPVPDAQPARTQAFLKISGKAEKEIDLGSFAGKPDVVDASKAERAGYPKDWVVGFRSYDANSGTGADVAIVPGEDLSHARVMQRRIDESASEPATFQIARELSLPGPSKITAKK